MLEMSFEHAIETLLIPEPIPPPPVNEYEQLVHDPQVPEGETWIHADWDVNVANLRGNSVRNWYVHQIQNQGMSIHMKMAIFWSSLLTSNQSDAGNGKMAYYYARLLLEYALGNYRDFLKAFTIEPLTLKFLNGVVNVKGSPDENFARELQELFTIGKGPEADFTEDDVVAAARVMTGWRYNWPNHNTHFVPRDHDTEDKQFSVFYGNKVIKGRSGMAGADETDELLDMLTGHPECAMYIARRLYGFFVRPEITEEAETSVIEPLAQVLRDSNYEMVPALRVLLSSAHFYDEENRGIIIKSPVDFIQGTFRTFGVEIPSDVELHEKFVMERAVWWLMSEQGFQFGDPPSVAGWPAYYQVPLFDKTWMTTNIVALRGLRTDSLIYWGFWTPSKLLNIPLLDFFEGFEDPGDPNKLIDEAIELLFGYDQIEDEAKDRLKTILLSGHPTDAYWEGAWADYTADRANPTLQAIVFTRLQRLLQVMLQMAEFQLH